MRAPVPLLLLCGSLASVSPAACGGDDTGSAPQPDAGDGKIHPEPNGVHVSEDAACQALLNGYEARYAALGCTVGTMRTCPSLVRAQVGGAMCVEYDEGSVQGCVEHYAKQTSCEALALSVDECVITAYLDTAPNGCP
jgi:hypothetical protein